MSWDVQLTKTPLDDAAGDPAEELGPAEAVRAWISAVHPAVDWTDPAWGVLHGGEWSIELNMGAEPAVQSIMLHVRGRGDPLPAIASLCKRYGWAAYDLTTGELLDPDRPSARGWKEFQRFRDLVTVLAAGNVDGTSLAHMKIEGNVLVTTWAFSGARSHDLHSVSSAQFRRAINWISATLGVVFLAGGVALKYAISLPWLGWLLLGVAVVVAVMFLATARGDWLIVEDSGRKFEYPLVGKPPEIAAFRATIESIMKMTGDNASRSTPE